MRFIKNNYKNTFNIDNIEKAKEDLINEKKNKEKNR